MSSNRWAILDATGEVRETAPTELQAWIKVTRCQGMNFTWRFFENLVSWLKGLGFTAVERAGFFLLLFLFPAIALCQTIPVAITHTTHKSGLSRGEARQVWTAARSQIEAEVGINLRLVSWRTRKGKPARVTSHQAGYFSNEPVHPDKRRLISIHLALPYRYQGKRWIGGWGTQCGSYAVVMVTRKKRYQENSLAHATAAVVHEIGHILGADHQSDASIMNGGALGLLEGAGWYLGFSAQSLAEIAECQGGRG